MVLTGKPAQTVSTTIATHRLLDPGDRVLAAFSGGADSTALALMLKELGYDVALAHVDHAMRDSSAGDAEHCERIASELGLPFFIRRLEVAPRTEAAARAARYKALEQMAAQAGASKIATGHTLDDQVETVLMRLQRGGKAWGIPIRRGRVVRPLIQLRRRDTEAMCHDRDVSYVIDPSNADLRFRRNLIRAKVVPDLDERAFVALLDAASINRAMAEMIEKEVGQAIERQEIRLETGRAEISHEWIQAAPTSMLISGIRKAAGHIGIELTNRGVADIEKKVVGKTGASLDLPKGSRVWAESSCLVFGFPSDSAAPPLIELEIPGSVTSNEWQMEVTAEILETPQLDSNTTTAYLDFDKVGGSRLVIRSRRPGDRFHPLGSRGRKKIQDFFVDEKIPREKRDLIPICVNERDEIVWVVGQRIDNRFRVTPSTARVLKLLVSPLPLREA